MPCDMWHDCHATYGTTCQAKFGTDGRKFEFLKMPSWHGVPCNMWQDVPRQIFSLCNTETRILQVTSRREKPSYFYSILERFFRRKNDLRLPQSTQDKIPSHNRTATNSWNISRYNSVFQAGAELLNH